MYVCGVIKMFMKMGKYFVVVLSAIVLAACSGKNGTVTDNNGVGVTDFEIGIVEKSLAADYLCEGDATFGDSVKLYTRTHVTLQWPEKLGNAAAYSAEHGSADHTGVVAHDGGENLGKVGVEALLCHILPQGCE